MKKMKVIAIWKDLSVLVKFDENGKPFHYNRNSVIQESCEGISNYKEYVDFLDCMINQESKLLSYEISKLN